MSITLKAFGQNLEEVFEKQLGHKLFSGSDDNFISAQLVNSHEIITYDTLKIEWFKNHNKIETFLIDLTDKKFKTKPNNPDLDKGGYFWGHDNKWYNWKPNFEILRKEIKNIKTFCKIPNTIDELLEECPPEE